MFERKLKALDYHHPNTFDINDGCRTVFFLQTLCSSSNEGTLSSKNRQQFTSLIVWLEDIKIRLYKIDDRKALRDTQSEHWPLAFEQYLKDLECPLDSGKKEQVLDWLLGHAVRLEYTGKAAEINKNWEEQKEKKKLSQEENNPEETIRNLQADDPDLKAGVMSLAHLLKIPNHEDPLVRLHAMRSLIEHKLSAEATAVASTQKKTELDSKFLQNMNLGFDTGDSAVNEAAKILRLLHVSELRELQTSITQAIVAVQSHTANPKTDTKLGKVGI